MRWRAFSRRRSASSVLVLDVVIDETLKLIGELFVRATHGRHMLAVDEDRAIGRFAGTGQADADVRRLRFTRAVHDTAHDSERHRLDALVPRLPCGHLVPN